MDGRLTIGRGELGEIVLGRAINPNDPNFLIPVLVFQDMDYFIDFINKLIEFRESQLKPVPDSFLKAFKEDIQDNNQHGQH